MSTHWACHFSTILTTRRIPILTRSSSTSSLYGGSSGKLAFLQLYRCCRLIHQVLCPQLFDNIPSSHPPKEAILSERSQQFTSRPPFGRSWPSIWHRLPPIRFPFPQRLIVPLFSTKMVAMSQNSKPSPLHFFVANVLDTEGLAPPSRIAHRARDEAQLLHALVFVHPHTVLPARLVVSACLPTLSASAAHEVSVHLACPRSRRQSWTRQRDRPPSLKLLGSRCNHPSDTSLLAASILPRPFGIRPFAFQRSLAQVFPCLARLPLCLRCHAVKSQHVLEDSLLTLPLELRFLSCCFLPLVSSRPLLSFSQK